MDEQEPCTSFCKKSINIIKTDVCIICKGNNGYLSNKEKEIKITAKGLKTFLQSCEDRQDEVASVVLPLRGVPELYQIRFHKSCRSAYTDLRKRQVALKRRQEDSGSHLLAKVGRLSRQETSSFSWTSHCFICGKPEDSRRGSKMSTVKARPRAVRKNVLESAIALGQEDVIQRLTFEEDIVAKNAKYHKSCYLKINLARDRKAVKEGADSVFDRACEEVYEELRDMMHDSMILSSELCKRYRACLIRSGVEPHAADKTRAFYIKKKMMEHYKDEISFYTQQGMPDIVCSSNITVGQLLRQTDKIAKYEIDPEMLENEDGCERNTDDLVLHKAAGIIRKDIAKLEPTNDFPNANELGLESSAAFAPNSLLKLLQWVIDQKAFESASPDYKSAEVTRRRYISLAECLIYCSRRGKTQVIPPFHVGLMTQLHDEHGSRNLIETLNSYGMCASYTELRMFQTAAAEDQISKAEDGIYVPPGVIPTTAGGLLIQEGDDNVDINVDTIDGKNTYHSMARVIFQQQSLTYQQLNIPRLQRSGRCSLKGSDASLLKPLKYCKPRLRPEPTRIKDAHTVIGNKLEEFKAFHCTKDLTWALLRQLPREVLPVPKGIHFAHSQIIPFWTGFNSMVSAGTANAVTVVTYPPIIEAPPSDMRTVYSTLKRGKDLAGKCGQNVHVHTFDQQLYAIAQMVKWSRPQEFPGLVIRLGGFHNLCTFIACIGKIWADAGLKDMLADSETYAPASVDSMLTGRQFHRATRGLTLVFEALVQILVTNFFNWLSEKEHLRDSLKDVVEQLCEVNRAFTEYEQVSSDTIATVTNSVEEKLIPLLDEFVAWGREQSATFTLWNNFMRAMNILLANIRADREGDWHLYLLTQVNMLPYFFVCDRQNYARWGSLYALEMLTSLPETVKQAFLAGQFAVNHTPGKFKGVWSDMAVEMTVIKDTKSDSGIIGLTRKGSAVLRWTCTRHIIGQYAEAMHQRSGMKSATGEFHEQAMPARLKRDEEDVQRMLRYIDGNMTDPFDVDVHPKLLINVGSGLVASADISKTLLNAVDKGQNMMSDFIKSRLSEDGTKSFYHALSKSGLKTFKDMRKTTNVKITGNNYRIAVSPELIYQRALTLAKVRPKVNLSTVLSHPVTVIPPALFKEDGSRRKNTKADLLHCLEDTVKQSVPNLPDTKKDISAYILDGMAAFQVMEKDIRDMHVFQDIAESFFQKTEKLLGVYYEVHIIFDRYDDDLTPKAEERLRRQGSKSGHKYQVESGRQIPNWKAFMDVSENKAQLTRFVSDYLEDAIQKRPGVFRMSNQKVILGGGYSSCTVTKSVTTTAREVDELASTQTEADTRMLLHAMDFDKRLEAMNTTGRLVISSPDTDVMVLLVYYMPQMKAVGEVWMETGKVTQILDLRRLIPIHNISNSLGEDICSVLPSFHAVTGCDTVSSFFGIGKKTALQTLRKMSKPDLACLQALRSDDEEAALTATRKFVSLLYDPTNKFSASHESLNTLLVRLAGSRCTPIAKLPPCEDSFLQHVKRASWQIKTWTFAHLPMPEIASPIEHGWKLQDNIVVPVFFEGPTALDKLQDFFCGCIGNSRCSSGDNCPCLRDGVGCSEVCRCEGCEKCQNKFNSYDNAADTADGLE